MLVRREPAMPLFLLAWALAGPLNPLSVVLWLLVSGGAGEKPYVLWEPLQPSWFFWFLAGPSAVGAALVLWIVRNWSPMRSSVLVPVSLVVALLVGVGTGAVVGAIGVLEVYGNVESALERAVVGAAFFASVGFAAFPLVAAPVSLTAALIIRLVAFRRAPASAQTAAAT